MMKFDYLYIEEFKTITDTAYTGILVESYVK